MELTASVTSAVIALASAVVSVYFSRRSLRMSMFQVRMQYFGDLRKWADEVAGTLSAAVHLCDLEHKHCSAAEHARRRHDLRAHLSALIDRGRWFFPNTDHESVGTHKEGAYRGYRPEVLDCLVFAYRVITDQAGDAGGSTGPEVREGLVKQAREFASLVQRALDPRSQAGEFARIG
jgi:hypothetical protein